MRIGIYISPSHAVPPNENNILAPWVLVAELANGLVAKKHAVTLFAAKNSKTNAKLIHGGIEPTVLRRHEYADPDAYRSFVIAEELALMREVIVQAKAGKLDIVHIHQPVERLYPALLAMPANVPVVITFHDPITPQRFPAIEKLMELGNIHLVSLSQSQQRGVPFPFAGIVPNGVDTKLFIPDKHVPMHKKPLLIAGRIVEQKGFRDAIDAAKLSGIRLLIVGQEYEQKEAKEYFETQVNPHIDGKTVLWESVVKQEHLIGHYQTAQALLFPIGWDEPFGLVMIEAMACGTPVIAYNRGSVSEIIVDGKTGFVVDPEEGVEGLVAAIKKIGNIDRVACRRHVEKHFSLKAMIDGYEKVYSALLG
jgi:glycosyltransferase involved in cell wall biosynthesis